MSIAKKSLETLLARVVMQLFAAAGTIVIARTLSTTGKGGFTYAGTMMGLLLMAFVGHNKAILWQYGRRALPPAAIIRVMIAVIAAISVPMVIALVLIGALIPSQSSLLFVAAAVPFAIFSQSAVGIFVGQGDVRVANITYLFWTVASTIVYVPLIIFVNRSLWVALAVWSAGYVAGAVYTAMALRPYWRRASADADSKAIAKEQVTFGAHACLSSLAQYLDFRMGVFIVMYMLGSAALGIYSVGIAISEFIWQLSSAMINPALKDIGGSDYERAADVTAKCMRHSFALVLLAAIFVAVLARPVVPLIYGRAFSYGAVITVALLPGTIAYSMMPALSSFFSQQLGTPRVPSVFSALSAVICGLLTVFTLPRFGLIAASIATSISYSAAFAAAIWYFTRQTKMPVTSLFAFSLEDLRPYRSLLASAAAAIRSR
ncbi:MAG: oligosaccharide flippase family protein [Candidatus Eremiobacteraeota bacterium]|nr:oligosaccharide flippase family protein [Candidatus Eremiobacteraeota bacterium]